MIKIFKLFLLLMSVLNFSSCGNYIDVTLIQSYKSRNEEIFYVDDNEYKRSDFVAKLDLSTLVEKKIYIPIVFTYEFKFEVDWGDGTIENFDKVYHDGVTFITHTYENSITRPIIKISGILEGFGSSTTSPPPLYSSFTQYVSDIYNFGDLGFKTLDGLFQNNNFLSAFAPLANNGYANLSNVISASAMFRNATKLINVDLSNLNLSNVINLNSIFRETTSLENIN